MKTVLILAGGAGTRLWPLSTDDEPKQFLELFDGASLIQRTFSRLRQVVAPEGIFVSTNERYLDHVVRQLPEVPRENILLEPARRNNAPAIAICCAAIGRRFPGSTIGVFPSDSAVGDEAAFLAIVRRAFEYAESSDSLMTIGINPTEPHTGYGYLELGAEVAPGVVKLVRFVEKPTAERAREFLASGNFAWNGGMFIWREELFRRVLAEVAPEIARLAAQYAAASDPAERKRIYEEMPSISIDYAVMEKAPDIATVRGEFDWSDVGSWAAVSHFTRGNAKLYTADAANVFAETGGRTVAIVGFDDVAVIESPRGILVLNMKKGDGMSELVKKIKN